MPRVRACHQVIALWWAVVLMLMIPGGVLVCVIFALPIVTPFTSRAVVVNCTASPTAIVCLGAVMMTENTDGAGGSLAPQAVRMSVVATIAAVLMKPLVSAQGLRPSSRPSLPLYVVVPGHATSSTTRRSSHHVLSESRCVDSR